MTGNDIIEITYLLAIPVANNTKKVQIFSEHGVIMFASIGVSSYHSYAKLLGRGNLTKLEKHCTWDDKFDRWAVIATMKRTENVSLLNQEKYNNHNRKDKLTIQPLSLLENNRAIKKIGDAMTEEQVTRAEYNTLKETGRPTTSKRYEKLK